MLKKRFSCKRKRKKMAITKKDLPRGSRVNANFKSKLALVLGTRNDIGVCGQNNKHGEFKKGEYQKLQHVLDTQKLPFTVTVKRFNGEGLNRENGLCTIQGFRKITKLQCVGPQADEISVPVSDCKISVKFLSIDNTALYSTIGEIRAKRREHNITWFTSTKEFRVNETTFTVGQIFTFAPSTLLSSFKRDRNVRGVHVCHYPTNKKLFFPSDTEGSFRKSDSPTTYQTCELSELAKTDNFPYFIVFRTNDTPVGLKKYTDNHLFVKAKHDANIVFVSRQIRGSLQIHSFPVHNDLYAKISTKTSSAPVDILDENELKMVKQSFDADAENGKGEMYRVKTYNELGIIRLLEEIFVELNNSSYLAPTAKIATTAKKDGKDNIKTDDRIYSKLITVTANNNTNNANADKLRKCYENRIIKTFLNSRRFSEAGYLKSIDKIGGGETKTIDYNYVTQHGCNFYVNEQTSSNSGNSTDGGDDESENDDKSQATTRRELVVEFDDGGYVIIPFSGKSPKISVEIDPGVESCKSRDNIAYNYKEKLTTSTEFADDNEHVYQYISSEELERNTRNYSSSTKIKEQVTIRCSNGNSTRQNQNRECTDSVLDRYSDAYDYPHLGHFSIPSCLSRRYIKDLCIEEVADFLKQNLLKHRIKVFRQLSIDGEKLSQMHEDDFLKLNFTKFEARKLNCFVDGWRPRNDGDTTQSWLSKLAKDWNVDDVSKYLLHLNMQSLQVFAIRHKVDGYFLTQMVSDDLLETLTQQHNLVLRSSDIQRLRNYILEDDKPKFKFFQ